MPAREPITRPASTMALGSPPEAATAAPRQYAPAMSGLQLAVLLSAMFMGQFDFFVVNVAAPSLRTDLHAGSGPLELIVGGYAFAYAAGLVSGGRLGDLFGYRRLFVAGMVGFALTSLACALAQSPAELVAARLGEGLTAAAMLPQVLALITASYPAPRRPRAIAWYSVASGAGAIAGQVLGGALISADVAGLGWRTIFLVNLPIGGLAALLAWRMLPVVTPAKRPQLDVVGATGAAATVAAVLFPLTVGQADSWPPWTWAVMAGAAPLATMTWWWERRLTDHGGTPLLGTRLLKAPTYRAGLAANAAFMCYFASFMFTLTLLLQDGLGLDAFHAGLVFAPAGLTFSIGALAGRPLLTRYGPRVAIFGGLVTATSLGAVAVALHASGTHTSVALIAILPAAASLGNGVVLPSLLGAALVDVPATQSGLAAGALNTAQQFAGTLGVAAIGALFFSVVIRSHDLAGYPRAMTWSAGTDAVLVLLVVALIQLSTRVATAHGAPKHSSRAVTELRPTIGD
ncbi:MAG: MFS transporter [Acidimicrobiales bacterium]